MLFVGMNTKKQGSVGIGAAIAYYSKLGYIVCISLNDSQDFDLVIYYGGVV